MACHLLGQAIIWTNDGLSLRALEANFSDILTEIWFIFIQEIHLKIRPVK